MMGTRWATRYDVSKRDNTHQEKNNTVRERIIEKLLEVVLSAKCDLGKIFWKSTWSRQKSGGPLVQHFCFFLQSDWFRACTMWYISKPHGPLLFFCYLKWKFCYLIWSFHHGEMTSSSGPPGYHHHAFPLPQNIMKPYPQRNLEISLAPN